MKKVISIFTIFLMALSCTKTDTTPACATVCQNGGIVTSGCNCNCPSGFTGANCQTAIAACHSNHTATVSFINHSANGYTYTIYWDNAPLTTVASGKTVTYPTAANVQRHIYAKANGTSIVSSVQVYTFQECSVNNLTWSF